MTRMSRLIGMPVVRDGKRMGAVDRVCIARCGRRIAGLAVQGVWLRTGFLAAGGIVLLGDACVLSGSALTRRMPAFQLRRVRDTSGLRLGVVTDALLCPETLRVDALELSFGLLDDVLRGRVWIRSFTVDAASGDVIAACGAWRQGRRDDG